MRVLDLLPPPRALPQVQSRLSKDAAPRREPATPLTGDMALVTEAIDLARKARTDEATATRTKIADSAEQKPIEWFVLRHSEMTANLSAMPRSSPPIRR